jgi:hypothetical protein
MIQRMSDANGVELEPGMKVRWGRIGVQHNRGIVVRLDGKWVVVQDTTNNRARLNPKYVEVID